MKNTLKGRLVGACVVALVMLLVSSSFATTIFEQNFDSDTLGGNAGWVPTNYQVAVVDTQSTSPNQSLQLHTNGADAGEIAYKSFTPTAQIFNELEISWDIKWVANDNDPIWGWRMNEGRAASGGTWVYGGLATVGGGAWVWNGGPGRGVFVWDRAAGEYKTILGGLTWGTSEVSDQWFHISVLAHFDTQTTDITATRVSDGATGSISGVIFDGSWESSSINSTQLTMMQLDDVQPRAGTTDYTYLDNLKIQTPAVPEPTSLFALAAGSLGLLLRRRRA